MASYKNNCDYCSIQERFFHTLRFKSIVLVVVVVVNDTTMLPTILRCRYNQSIRKIQSHYNASVFLFLLANPSICLSKYQSGNGLEVSTVGWMMRFKSKENILRWFGIVTTMLIYSCTSLDLYTIAFILLTTISIVSCMQIGFLDCKIEQASKLYIYY